METMMRCNEGSIGSELDEMNRLMIALPIFVVAALTLSFALADRLEKRATADRFSFDDSSATELTLASCDLALARDRAATTCGVGEP
jgi:hypothetical protein